MINLLFLVIYLSAVLQEIGNKLTAPSPLDDPMFYYRCGYSFYCAVIAFICTQGAAVFTLCVYMAKHDEEMYNRYHIRNMFKSSLMGMFLNGWQGHKPFAQPKGRYKRSSSVLCLGSFASIIPPSSKLALPDEESQTTMKRDTFSNDTLLSPISTNFRNSLRPPSIFSQTGTELTENNTDV